MKVPFLLSVTAALTLFGCTGDPAGPDPDTFDIVVHLDWPMVREQGFVDARWEASTSGYVPAQDSTFAEGVFDGSGKALVEYAVYCRPGDYTGVGLRMWGRYTAYGDAVCYVHISGVECTAEPQYITVERPPDQEFCQQPE
jgi:hypothetical protein